MKEFKSFYKEVTGNEGSKCLHNKRLDTYGCGCSHDCSYCYAKSLLDFRKLWNASEPSVADIPWNDPRTAKNRSKTFPGIAKAMAEQWAGNASKNENDNIAAI